MNDVITSTTFMPTGNQIPLISAPRESDFHNTLQFPIKQITMPFGACKLMLMHRTAVLRDEPLRQVEVSYERKVKIPFAMKLMKDFRCCLQYNKTFSRLCLCSSRKMTPGHPVYVQKNEPFLRMFQRLGIGFRVVELLYEYFQCIDRDGSGEISLSEFFIFFQMKDTEFARRAFSVMDEDGSGEIDFGEFVLTIWNYATFSKEGLTRFAFELYDADRSGYIDMDEMMMILRQMFGKRYKTNALANKLMKQMLAYDWRGDELEEIGDGSDLQITFLSFQNFCKKHPGMLFPAFHIQMELQQGILGTAFWTEQAKQQEKTKSAQARLKLEAAVSGNSFSSRDYTIQSAQDGDLELLNQLNSMTSEMARNDIFGFSVDVEDMDPNMVETSGVEVNNGQHNETQSNFNTSVASQKKRQILQRSNTTRKAKQLQNLRKSDKRDLDKRQKDKKELKEKIKKQLRNDRKKKAQNLLEDGRKKAKKTLVGKLFGGAKINKDIAKNDPRRKLILMKKDRVEKKDKKYIVDIKTRKSMIEKEKCNIPWVCLACHRSNYPDSQRCQTCHARPNFVPKI